MAEKILVVGGGGREHAIIKALKKSPDCGEIWCAPGNGGISYDAKCKNIKSTDVDTMVGFAVEEKFDYVVVAQDDPLALGMVDALAAVGIPAFGPDKAAARIEASYFAVGMPYFFIRSLENTLEASMRAAALSGPKAGMPTAASASTMPRARGSSCATTT